MKLNVFTSTTKDGIMSKDKKYFEKLSKEEINKLYEVNLQRFLSKYNLNIENTVLLNDKNDKITSRVVTKSDKNIKDKILILKENNPNLVVLVETDDDPIIVASAKDEKEKQVVAIAKGTIKNLTNDLIHEMTEALIKHTNAATFEMNFYIGPCPSKENYLLTDKKIIENKNLKKAIEYKNDKIYLDIRYAIFNELYNEIVDPNNIYFDSTDTVESFKHYSRIGKRFGKNVSCVVFTEEI